MGEQTMYILMVAGIIGAMILIMVPLLIRKAVKSKKASNNFVPDFLNKTGLQQNGDTFEGIYKGYPIQVKTGLGVNMLKMAKAASSMMSGGSANLYGTNTFNVTLNIRLNAPGVNFPPFMLKEKTNWALRTDQFMQEVFKGQTPNLPELKINRGGLGKIHLYGHDENLAQKIVSDTELQRLLSDWYGTNINLNEDKIAFIMDDTNALRRFGAKRMSSPNYIIQGMDICVRLAQIAKQN